eukprot:403352666
MWDNMYTNSQGPHISFPKQFEIKLRYSYPQSATQNPNMSVYVQQHIQVDGINNIVKIENNFKAPGQEDKCIYYSLDTQTLVNNGGKIPKISEVLDLWPYLMLYNQTVSRPVYVKPVTPQNNDTHPTNESESQQNSTPEQQIRENDKAQTDFKPEIQQEKQKTLIQQRLLQAVQDSSKIQLEEVEMKDYHEYLFSKPLGTKIPTRTCLKLYFDTESTELRDIVTFENYKDIYRPTIYHLIEPLKEVKLEKDDLKFQGIECSEASEELQTKVESYLQKFLKVINCE